MVILWRKYYLTISPKHFLRSWVCGGVVSIARATISRALSIPYHTCYGVRIGKSYANKYSDSHTTYLLGREPGSASPHMCSISECIQLYLTQGLGHHIRNVRIRGDIDQLKSLLRNPVSESPVLQVDVFRSL